eukprot:CAMPEP_0197177844 /NCGR_PEP_ID=MMETSP1423-20130617/3306_1 /TAXON_ID=476441 /ORGANISM="Pseudo-nitzschia heimii, Strain UNC1101" /LENGTH=658 /DNA_ID=CAMNT_0042627457 /DNA_START=122 /DNA_END=2098 /DNA_ORIENTATION=-
MKLNPKCSSSSTLSAHPEVVVETNSNFSLLPRKLNVKREEQDLLRAIDEDDLSQDCSSANIESFSSTEDDSSNGTATGTSCFNNESDSETIVTTSSKYTNCDNSLVPNDCTSGAESSGKRKADRMNDTDPNNVDKLLVEELQELSVVDRGMVQEEIHGVSTCAVLENDAQIMKSLKCMEEEIRKIRREILASPERVSKAGNIYYESIWSYLAIDDVRSSTSIRLSYSYIFHRDFRLKFLRADLHDAEKAAHRYLRCIEGLLKYFGNCALQRPLVFENLGKECQDAAKEGFIQILPSRDRAGRLVVVSQAPNSETTMATILKLFTYVFQVVSEDIETQKRGVIFVYSSDENALTLISNSASKREYNLYREGSPVRRSCTHFCLPEDNPKMRIVRAIMMLAMSREERVRTRIQMDGFTTETHYKLMTFGIPISEIPITSTGAIKTKHHLQWIKTRKAIDASRIKSLEECYDKIKEQQKQYHSITTNNFFRVDFYTYPPTYDQFLNHHGKEPIIYPMINDVLFSKGGKNVTHYGNIEFTDFLRHALKDYVTRTPLQNRKMRKAIRQSIIEKVRARGGRFLTLDKKLPGGYCWTEIEKGHDLHDRIATSLYDHRRRLAAKKKLTSSRSATAMFTAIDNSKRRKIENDDGVCAPVDFMLWQSK